MATKQIIPIGRDQGENIVDFMKRQTEAIEKLSDAFTAFGIAFGALEEVEPFDPYNAIAFYSYDGYYDDDATPGSKEAHFCRFVPGDNYIVKFDGNEVIATATEFNEKDEVIGTMITFNADGSDCEIKYCVDTTSGGNISCRFNGSIPTDTIVEKEIKSAAKATIFAENNVTFSIDNNYTVDLTIENADSIVENAELIVTVDDTKYLATVYNLNSKANFYVGDAIYREKDDHVGFVATLNGNTLHLVLEGNESESISISSKIKIEAL